MYINYIAWFIATHRVAIDGVEGPMRLNLRCRSQNLSPAHVKLLLIALVPPNIGKIIPLLNFIARGNVAEKRPCRLTGSQAIEG